MFGSKKKNKKKDDGGKLSMSRSWSEDSSVSKHKEDETTAENKKVILKASKASPKESRKHHTRKHHQEQSTQPQTSLSHARTLPSYDSYMVHQRNRRTVTVTSESIANNTQAFTGQSSNLHVRPISTPPKQSTTVNESHADTTSKKHTPKRPTNLDLLSSNTDNNIAPVEFPYAIRHHNTAKHSSKCRPIPPPRTVSQPINPTGRSASRPASYHPRVSSEDFVYNNNNNNYIIYPHQQGGDYPSHNDLMLTQSVSNGHLPESFYVDSTDLRLRLTDTEGRAITVEQSNAVRVLYLERRGLKDCLCFLEKARSHLQCRLDRVNERLTTLIPKYSPTDSQPDPISESRNSYASNLSGSSQIFPSHHLQVMHEKMEQACELMIEAIGDKNSSLKRPNSRNSSRISSLAYAASPISQENDLRKQVDLYSAELNLCRQRITELERQKANLINSFFSDQQTSYLSTDI